MDQSIGEVESGATPVSTLTPGASVPSVKRKEPEHDPMRQRATVL